MNQSLRVENLRVAFRNGDRIAKAVDGISFSVEQGKTLAIVGESGCGKSATALSLMGLIPAYSGEVSASRIEIGGKVVQSEGATMDAAARRQLRGKTASMIFQEPMSSLNPVLTIGYQLGEVFRAHGFSNEDEIREKSIELLELTGIPEARKKLNVYPHELSGGMKQRVMIAMAIALKPTLLISDEPTTALDVTIQAQILDLISEIQKKNGMSQLLITHDLGLVKHYADMVAVMYAGRIIEHAATKDLLDNPIHPYTRSLLAALPREAGSGRKRLYTIPGQVAPATDYPSWCHYFDRCYAAKEGVCNRDDPTLVTQREGHAVACLLAQTNELPPLRFADVEKSAQPKEENRGAILEVQKLSVYYPIRKGLLKKVKAHVHAVEDVSFEIAAGETLGLVGESGCGKTTLGKSLVGLAPKTKGSIRFEGREIIPGISFTGKEKHTNEKSLQRKMQIIFQDPYASLNPRIMVGEAIREAMKIHFPDRSREEQQTKVIELLRKTGLSESAYYKYPHEFSGGQRQRITIARALAVEPQFIICDEATSALDVSVQAQIVNLLLELQQELGLTYLFISHNLSLVRYIADEVAIMYLGRVMEYGKVNQIFQDPRHPYTRALLSSALDLTSGGEPKIKLAGDLPSPVHPPSGCVFRTRCPEAIAACANSVPGLKESHGRQVACIREEES